MIALDGAEVCSESAGVLNARPPFIYQLFHRIIEPCVQRECARPRLEKRPLVCGDVERAGHIMDTQLFHSRVLHHLRWRFVPLNVVCSRKKLQLFLRRRFRAVDALQWSRLHESQSDIFRRAFVARYKDSRIYSCVEWYALAEPV